MDAARRMYSRDLKIAAMPKLVERWRGEWQARGELAFPGIGRRGLAPALTELHRIAELERKIGQLTMENDFLTKALEHFRDHHPPAVVSGEAACLRKSGKPRAKGEAVNALCQMTGISRAGYYRWRVPPPRFPIEMELRDAMQQVALEFPDHGYSRITFELNRCGFAVNHKRVLRLMRADNLLCLRHKSFVATTDSRHTLPVYPNLARDM
jgi:hypothetical protein